MKRHGGNRKGSGRKRREGGRADQAEKAELKRQLKEEEDNSIMQLIQAQTINLTGIDTPQQLMLKAVWFVKGLYRVFDVVPSQISSFTDASAILFAIRDKHSLLRGNDEYYVKFWTEFREKSKLTPLERSRKQRERKKLKQMQLTESVEE
tara:strand:+ start:7127 stop:7576 length:450 start_codon:yes stop_codon:yes gene_type:complete